VIAKTTSTPKNIFVVLGVARSGTSAIARGLKALGIELGSNMNPGNSKWNAKGFWEDIDIVYKINGKVFSILDFAPYGIKTLDHTAQTSEKLQEVKLAAINLLNQRFAETDYWGFKDPSTIKLLTFWQTIFQDLHLKENYIIALRNPLAAAQSYEKVTGSKIEIGLLLWLMHIIPAIDETALKNRVIVSYDLLLQNPLMQLNRIKSQLNIPALSDSAEIDTYTQDFLDKKLHRHECSEQDLVAHPAVAIAPLCIRTYYLLMKVACDEITFESTAFHNEWCEIKTELEKIYPVYCYIDSLLKENNQLKKTLRGIHKSILWKMLYPFRIVDHTLRAHRQKSRAEKRLNKAYG